MRILIDAFGGDNSPKEVIEGALCAIQQNSGFTAVLVGKKEVIEEQLKDKTFDKERIKILDAQEVITCEEEPTLAIRRKPDSSISVAIKELKESDATCFVSAGSTGAVLVGATLKLGRIKGVVRPALAPILPTAVEGKNVILMDAGANADCKSINLCQFAIMGSVYAKSLGVENPKVALLSNGTEDEKGNALCHEVFPLLKNMKTIDFIGNLEARDILSGKADVVICDGFSGNVALKSMEGLSQMMLGEIKNGVMKSLKTKIGGLLLKPVFKSLKQKLDYNKKGGALFIGVNKPVIKVHGSSKSKAFCNAILQAVSYSDFDLSSKIENAIATETIEIGEQN